MRILQNHRITADQTEAAFAALRTLLPDEPWTKTAKIAAQMVYGETQTIVLSERKQKFVRLAWAYANGQTAPISQNEGVELRTQKMLEIQNRPHNQKRLAGLTGREYQREHDLIFRTGVDGHEWRNFNQIVRLMRGLEGLNDLER